MAPATVANVSCGFDIMGFALEQPCDQLQMRLLTSDEIIIKNLSDINIPLLWQDNVSGVAVKALMNHLEYKGGVEIIFQKKIRPGSGIGSSAASSAGAVWGLNKLLGSPLSNEQLVPFAMEGERLASGNAHADNVAPALMGGFVLIRSYKPLDLISIPTPKDLICTIIHPFVELRTRDARKILKKDIPLSNAIQQWGNTAALVAGLMKQDYHLIGDSLEDVIIEPLRGLLIPCFPEIKAAVNKTGALGCGISGSGPSVFILSHKKDVAQKCGEDIYKLLKKQGIDSQVYHSHINPQGVTGEFVEN